MTTVGLVGGIGPESTIDYYRRILAAWEREAPGTSPSIVIDSLDVRLGLRLVEKDRPAFIDYVVASVRRLAGAGVDFVAMTANTPHIVFDEIAARATVPLVSIVDACAEEARRRGLNRLALFGTRFTMEAPRDAGRGRREAGSGKREAGGGMTTSDQRSLRSDE
jgi:aspartate racemase